MVNDEFIREEQAITSTLLGSASGWPKNLLQGFL